MALIEKSLPVEKLNPVAMAEGNSKRPIYQMHKWWARRLGSVFRMITLATFAQEIETDDALWHKFCEGADLEGKTILDPFMGGGTTICEALRLGCRVIGVDINPVAWFVTKKEIEPVGLADLDRAFETLARNVGERIRRYYRTMCPAGHLVRNWPELGQTDRGALLLCQSSEKMSFLPDRSVDAVITDPPYFDSIQYSELADFFYVWLRLALHDTYPWFAPELSHRPAEIVQNDNLGKTTDVFAALLQRVFAECHRVLKDDGLLIFTFHHNKNWAWEELAHLLLAAGFYISATPIVRSEGKSGFHSSAGNIRYDCVLVCRKDTFPPTATPWPALRDAIRTDAIAWTRRTLAAGLAVGEVDVYTIVMGKTIEKYTQALCNGAGPRSVGLASGRDGRPRR